MTSLKLTIQVHHDYGDMRAELLRIRKESDFSQVVLEGINAMQRFQRALAPVGKTGPGPHGRIPRSIRPATIYRGRDGAAWATSRTDYGPALFTSLGTGEYGPRKRAYFVVTDKQDIPGILNRRAGYFHPGQKGTNWWERGANLGSPIALAAFQRKVETLLKLRR